MVEIVSAVDFDRIASLKAAQLDAIARQKTLRNTDSIEGRGELTGVAAEAGQTRPNPIRAARFPTGLSSDLSAESEFRSTRLARLLDNPETMTSLLESTQGIDRQPATEGDRMLQASLIKDAYDRSIFISMIDPGREISVLIAREKAKLNDVGFA